MIENKNGLQTITCDKCGTSDSQTEDIAGLCFYRSGWSLKSNAKKYKHLCFKCQPAKQKKITKWSFNNHRI